jgi:hypothetical protein
MINPWKPNYMKRFITLVFVLINIACFAQEFNNEWIEDFNKTYYKFKVASTGLHRISQASLDSAGIGNIPVEQYKLFHNGKEVPLYTSVSSGSLPANGFLEFWGEMNDGKPDKPLYRDPNFQHSTQWSLQTDTSTYFLTISSGVNLRFNTAVNDVANNTLPREPYFMYTYEKHFRETMNYGLAAVVGEYVYSSAYDQGEFFSSTEIWAGQTRRETLSNLFVYPGGEDPTLKFGATGNAPNIRNVSVRVNNTLLIDTAMNLFNDLVASVKFPVTLLSPAATNIDFKDGATVPNSDRIVLSFFDLTYPRQFNFGGNKNFSFHLPAKETGYYLAIANFNRGTQEPVLYDVTNRQRYVGVSSGDTVKFLLPPSASEMSLVLANQELSNIKTAYSLISKTFINYSDPANQGDYIIISNPVLFKGDDGRNPVDEYRAYRASAQGGSYNAKIYDINDLVDQFAFGIKKHPLSIKNFLRFARERFSKPPQFVFLIGRGVEYVDYRYNESNPLVEKLNLVPSFGYPASDNMLTTVDGASFQLLTPIGRLSVVTTKEIDYYLEKVKEYEAAQKQSPNTIAGRLWMKNAIHVTGASDSYLGTVLCNYMEAYKQILEDTLTGANVTVFCKNSTNPVEQLSNERISRLFEEGLSLVTYFGHSSSTTLEFNLDDPQNYNNVGKYPVFSVNGCNAGNFFTFDPQRFSYSETLSEKFVLAKQHGAIAFIASTHYGIVNYLNIYINALYNNIAVDNYNLSLGEINRNALQHIGTLTGNTDYYARAHTEEITLHGDPALKLNYQELPDYVIEQPQVKISPAFISIAENKVDIYIKAFNLGKAIRDSIVIKVEREFPDGSKELVDYRKIRAIYYSDSIHLTIPVVATRDKGLNKLIITLDAENTVAEIDETNNTVTKDFFVYEDEAKPAFPYNYAIVNRQDQKLYASTANPFSNLKQYVLEIDTTLLFNSSMKVAKFLTSVGGILEFDPGMVFQDSVVYYWRVSLVPTPGGDFRWNHASFLFLEGHSSGFSQSHYFQHTESDYERLSIDGDRTFRYGKRVNNLFIRNTTYPTGSGFQSDYVNSINGDNILGPGCIYNELIFQVIDAVTFKPWRNNFSGPTGLYNSLRTVCGSQREYNFDYEMSTSTSRKYAMDFLDAIPEGSYVIVRNNNNPDETGNTYVNAWKADTAIFGSGKSLYHKFLEQGFIALDSFNKSRAWIFVFKKGRQQEFIPKTAFTETIYDRVAMSVDCSTPDTVGYITSPKFGPAKTWNRLTWGGNSNESPSADRPTIEIFGVDSLEQEFPLYSVDITEQEFDLSGVNASQFPFLKLRMHNLDSVTLTPYQLKFWTLDYEAVPEGALAPNIVFKTKDTLEVGEMLDFKIAFKNFSGADFDSLKINFTIIDRNNIPHNIELPRGKPLISGDTLVLQYSIDTKDYPEMNTLFVDFNADNDQREQYHYNNFLYRNFYVKPDKVNPLMDVTFDGVHILNEDIISPKPHIQIKLTDEAKYMLMNDTSIVKTIEVKYPDENNTVRKFKFDNDTLRFIPPTSSADNTAVIDFSPYFPQILGSNGQPLNPDGDEYELIVKGTDRSGNKAGQIEYRVSFTVINKPMISNMFNYPNPFTTSTAFVFTLTGSEIPQNIKIQIMTVTGKVVREITKEELGPISIGRNITEFKWNGTDQYGQRLANGVYLFRVVTSLNGSKLDKYKAPGETTDRFFNHGYGKMYLMR